MLKIIHQLYNILTPRERREVFWVFGAFLLMATIDIIGMVSVLPFMAVLTDPSIVFRNSYLEWIYYGLNFVNIQYYLFFLGCMSLLILTIATTINVGGNWIFVRFARKCQHEIKMRLATQYLRQPYIFHLKRSPSDLAENILIEVDRCIEVVLIPLLNVLARGTIALFVIVLLLIVDPVIALTVVFLLGGAYAGIYLWIRKELERIGEDRHEAYQMLFKTSSEIFNEIKIIKLHGKEEACIQRYSDPSKRLIKYLQTQQLTEMLPRYFLELLAFGGMLIITLYFIMVLSDWGKALPLIVLYAFAGYRLLPSLQHVFAGLNLLRFNAPALDVLFRDITNTKDLDPNYSGEDEISNSINLKKQLEIKNLTFFYPGESKPTLRDINLTISVNSLVALVGSTGAGKTTLVDLILGLLRPQHGSILVDGVSINGNNLIGWQKNLGYVPQNIVLFDDTIAANIAFWVLEENIDMANVVRVAQTAQIHDFIMNDLPDGYDTVIGEQGIRLSAGEKQRIGIARALYQKPSILILDEATNALDGITENHFMKAIHDLAQKMTIISIAHRLSTVRECDAIYMLTNKTIIGRGTFDELMETCPQFRELGKASHHLIG